MADLGFLPAVRRLLAATPQSGQRLLFSATLDRGVSVLVKQFLSQPVTHEADSVQGPIALMDHHVLHVSRDQRVPVLVDLTSAPGPDRGLHPHQARREGAGPPAQPQRRAHRRAARQPQPGRPHPQHGRLPRRPGHHARGHRHRGARHPRGRRRPRGARRPAGRAQGLPAPLGPYGARRCRRHRHHDDDRGPGARRARPGQGGRHQADHHPRRRTPAPDADHPGPGRARARRRRHGRQQHRGARAVPTAATAAAPAASAVRVAAASPAPAASPARVVRSAPAPSRPRPPGRVLRPAAATARVAAAARRPVAGATARRRSAPAVAERRTAA